MYTSSKPTNDNDNPKPNVMRKISYILSGLLAILITPTTLRAQAMKEIETGLENVKLYASADGFVVKSTINGQTLAYGHGTAGDELPPAMQWWLEEYDRELGYAKEMLPSKRASASPRAKSSSDSVAPLIDSRWRQYIGYNLYCPADTTLADIGGHTTTGCVATAMAQIMRYWQFPQHGMGSISFTHEGEYPCWRYGTLSADFANTQYDWEYMPQVLTDSSTEREIDAVATLCYHCGVSVYMMYNNDCQGSSGAYTSYASTALTNTFHYKQNHNLNRNSYSAEQWTSILKNELRSGRPVLYAGQSIEDTSRGVSGGGHAFLTDGYDTAGFFHFNWGWGGWYDGYFLISALDPSGRYEFNYSQQAVVGIEPEHGRLAIPMLTDGISLDGEDFQMGGNVSGSYAVTNIGDTVYNGYIGVNVYSPTTYDFYGWLDATEVHIQPGETVYRTFDNPGMTRPVGVYYALGQYNDTPLYVTDQVDNALTCFNNGQAYFNSVDSNRSELRNVTVCVSFADDNDTLSLTSATLYNTLQNSGNGVFSLPNYINATTDGKHHMRTIATNPAADGRIISYRDTHSRSYYQPSTPDNPTGYTCSSICSSRISGFMRFIAEAVENSGVLDSYTVIDGDGDGYIDNLTIVIADGENIFNSGDKPYCDLFEGTMKIGPRKVGNYSIVNETADVSHYCYAALRMLGLPDMSHAGVYADIHPLGEWDMMDEPNRQQPSYILKHKYLNIGSEPVAIDTDGWYTISGTSPCYSIETGDGTTRYLFELRDQGNFFDQGIPSSGLTVGLWNDEGINREFFNGQMADQYRILRPGATDDTTQGDLSAAAVAERRTYMLADSSTFTVDSVTMGNGLLTFKVAFSANSQNPGEPLEPEEPDNPELSVDSPTSQDIQIAIYPNPTSGIVYANAKNIKSVEVLSVSGHLITNTDRLPVDLTRLSPGIYFLRITTAHGISVKKVIRK